MKQIIFHIDVNSAFHYLWSTKFSRGIDEALRRLEKLKELLSRGDVKDDSRKIKAGKRK